MLKSMLATSLSVGFGASRQYVILAVALIASGCGGANDKVIVTGKVTLDGRAVSNGDIRFYPSQGTTGRASGAPIVDGQYRAHYQGGVPVGTHRVEIRAFVLEGIGPASGPANASADLVTAAPAGQRRNTVPLPVYVVEGREQFLPPRFNERSQLEIVITGEEAEETHDFALSSGSQ